MRELLETLDTWRADPGSSPAVGRAIVVRTFGSAPRPEGQSSSTRMTAGLPDR